MSNLNIFQYKKHIWYIKVNLVFSDSFPPFYYKGLILSIISITSCNIICSFSTDYLTMSHYSRIGFTIKTIFKIIAF